VGEISILIVEALPKTEPPEYILMAIECTARLLSAVWIDKKERKFIGKT